MDSNRGLRKVPVVVPGKGTKETTSSADAVAKAIHLRENHQVYLCQVLPNPLDQILPNPLNEVAGVFHIKAYIVDDVLILSGANLSEEYFSDRHDRYLQISNGGNGLVDFYAQLIDILCHDASDPYDDPSQNPAHKDPSGSTGHTAAQKPIEPFWESLHCLFTAQTESGASSSSQALLEDSETVAVCVPTFHHPQMTPPHNQQRLPSDVDVTLTLLEESPKEASVQMSSAYLNPSPLLLRALQRHSNVDLLTAGRLSHGFRPKPKAGNKGTAWIPTVFDRLQYEAFWTNSRLWHWQRDGWTFHAKGLWLQAALPVNHNDETRNDKGDEHDSDVQDDTSPLLAAMVGSSNFGRRSFERDVESNLVFVFPPTSQFAKVLHQEWKMLISNSVLIENPKKVLVDEAPPLPFHVRLLFPFIKSFF
jgi:CDP-diacylglycerol---glycerol-3-phosphate 3-phosphatidyltransferase